MKENLKLLISAFYILIASVSSFWGRILFGINNSKLLTLYYHSIPSDEKENLIWQIGILRKLGKIVPLNFKINDKKIRRYFSITFDDGYENLLKNAVPYLEDNNIPYSIFISTAYMGKTAEWQHYNKKNILDETILSKNQILNLNMNLATIGSHTAHHLVLTQLPYQQRLIELTESKKTLENLLDSKISLLSLPYGEYDNELIKLAKETGYDKVFSSEPEFIYGNSENENYVTGRISICPEDSRIKFIIKILGGYNWLSKYCRLKNKIKTFI